MSTAEMLVDVSVSPYDLEVGDVIVLDQVPNLVQAVDCMTYDFAIAALPAGSSNTEDVTNLAPGANEIYWVDSLGIDGQVTASVQYPTGATRGVPHGKAILYDQTIADKDNPFPLNIWIASQTEPTLNETMPATAVSTSSDVWFYGLQFKVASITLAQMALQLKAGYKAIYVTSAYQPQK